MPWWREAKMVMNRTRDTDQQRRSRREPSSGTALWRLRRGPQSPGRRQGRTEPQGPDRGLSRRRGPSRPAGTRRPVSRSRRSCRGPRCSRSCLMPGIIRCPESTAIQAGNPDRRGPRRGSRRFCLQRGSRVRIPGRRGQRSHSVVVVVPLSVPFARLEPRRWWLRTDACRRVGIAAPAGDLR
jgi:hypothetical protein